MYVYIVRVRVVRLVSKFEAVIGISLSRGLKGNTNTRVFWACCVGVGGYGWGD